MNWSNDKNFDDSYDDPYTASPPTYSSDPYGFDYQQDGSSYDLATTAAAAASGTSSKAKGRVTATDSGAGTRGTGGRGKATATGAGSSKGIGMNRNSKGGNLDIYDYDFSTAEDDEGEDEDEDSFIQTKNQLKRNKSKDLHPRSGKQPLRRMSTDERMNEILAKSKQHQAKGSESVEGGGGGEDEEDSEAYNSWKSSWNQLIEGVGGSSELYTSSIGATNESDDNFSPQVKATATATTKKVNLENSDSFEISEGDFEVLFHPFLIFSHDFLRLEHLLLEEVKRKLMRDVLVVVRWKQHQRKLLPHLMSPIRSLTLFLSLPFLTRLPRTKARSWQRVMIELEFSLRLGYLQSKPVVKQTMEGALHS